MSGQVIAICLSMSVLASVMAAAASFWPSGKSHKLTSWLLAVGGVLGAVAGLQIMLGETQTVMLPYSLYPVTAVDPVSTWPWFFDMVFGLDRFSAIFYTLISVVTAMVMVYSVKFIEIKREAYNLKLYGCLVACLVLGMQGVLLSTNIFGFIGFWELMVFCIWGLFLVTGSVSGQRAGFTYLAIAHLGTGAILAGLFILSNGGLLNDFVTISSAAADLPMPIFAVACALILLGFGSQLGVVPFHVWLPQLQVETPTPAAALITGAGLGVGVYGLLRTVIFLVPTVPGWFVGCVLGFGILTALVGSLHAVVDLDVKQTLGYFSLKNVGLLLIFIGTGLLAGLQGNAELTETALYAGLFLCLAQGVLQTAMGLVAGVAEEAFKTRELDLMGGLAQSMPKLSVAACVIVLAAVGLPPFAPFIAEWSVVQAAVGIMATAEPVLVVSLVGVVVAVTFVTGVSLMAGVKWYAGIFLARPRQVVSTELKELDGYVLGPIAVAAVLSVLLAMFAPRLLAKMGAIHLAPPSLLHPALETSGGGLAPSLLTLVMAGGVLALLLLRQLIVRSGSVRVVPAWDHGQVVGAKNEYSITGLTAPFRYFFRFFLRTQKVVDVQAVQLTNPWVVTKHVTLVAVRQLTYVRLGEAITRVASCLAYLQNGSVQFYVLLMIVALLITMVIAL
ncbi:MAG: proton-conducting transporter membrane subunit [Patescibacteria group bacterium]